MIQTNTVERVQECKAALNFMSLNHCLEDLVNRDCFSSPSKMISNSQDSTQIIGGMTPLI